MWYSIAAMEAHRTASFIYLVLLCLVVGFVARHPDEKPYAHAAEANHALPLSFSEEDANSAEKTKYDPDDTSGSYPHWYDNPEWWLTIIALFSIGLLWRQWRATEVAANAASDSAKTLIGSERAWIMVDLEPSKNAFQVSTDNKYTHINVTCICTNHGKTPAKITEIRAAGIILEEVGTTYSLPDIPDRDKLIEEMSGLETVTSSNPLRHSLTIACDGPRKPGRTVVVYGVIKYKHLFSEGEVETTFGYRITPGDGLVRLDNDHPKYNENT